MQILRLARCFSFFLLMLRLAAPSFAGVSVSVTIAPPVLPVYEQPPYQVLDLRRFSRSAASPFTTAIVFLRDQPAMPGQQSLGSDNRSHLSEKLASQSLCPHRQSAALV